MNEFKGFFRTYLPELVRNPAILLRASYGPADSLLKEFAERSSRFGRWISQKNVSNMP